MNPVPALAEDELASSPAAVEACARVHPEVMFPSEISEDGEQDDDLPNDHPLVLAAKAVCAGCPVRDLCGEAAMGRRERWGIWGGMTHRELEAMRRRLSRASQRARQAAALVAAGPALAAAPKESRVHQWAEQLGLFEVSA